jgi:RimJ/RimL family protein N-acetyltransferase
MFELLTERLRLRQLTADDQDFVVEMLADREVMRHYPRPLSRDESLAWIDRQLMRYARDGHGLWLTELRDGGGPVGQVGLAMQPVSGTLLPEIAYLLHRTFWGYGYATEAACAVRDWAFECRGYGQVISLIRPENLPSQAVARRVGMTLWKDMAHAGLVHHVFSRMRAEGKG